MYPNSAATVTPSLGWVPSGVLRTTPSPMSVGLRLRRIARCGGLFNQSETRWRGVLAPPLPSARISPAHHAVDAGGHPTRPQPVGLVAARRRDVAEVAAPDPCRRRGRAQPRSAARRCAVPPVPAPRARCSSGTRARCDSARRSSRRCAPRRRRTHHCGCTSIVPPAPWRSSGPQAVSPTSGAARQRCSALHRLSNASCASWRRAVCDLTTRQVATCGHHIDGPANWHNAP